MNNWRLLLLALVAVVQPIASVTHLVDGRHQCCGREARLQLRDSREQLYGSDRLTKTVYRRVDNRDDVREDRRTALSRSSIDSRHIREISWNNRAESLDRSRRVDYRQERGTNDRYRDRVLSQDERARVVRATKNIQADEQNRRIGREFFLRQNDRARESSRLSRDRDINRVFDDRRFSTESRREAQRIRASSQLAVARTPIRQSRNEFREYVAPIRDLFSNRRQVTREINAIGERSARVEFRSFGNNENRVSERRNDVNSDRRLTRTVDEIRETGVRLSRELQNKPHAKLVVAQRFDHRREQREDSRTLRDRTNSIRSLSRDMMLVRENRERKSASLSRVIDQTNVRVQRNDNNRRELRINENRVSINRREVKNNDAGFSRRTRDNRMEIRNDVSRITDTRDERVRDNNRRLMNSLEERTRENVRDNERQYRERHTGDRREVRSAERVKRVQHQSRVLERLFIDENNENPRRISITENRREIRDAERRIGERNNEYRREIRSAQRVSENRRDARTDERRFREIRNAERRLSETGSDGTRNNRRVVRVGESREERIREIRDMDRRSSDRNIDTRREIRHNQMRTRDTERTSDRDNYGRREFREVDRIRVARANERRFVDATARDLRNSQRRFRERETNFGIRRDPRVENGRPVNDGTINRALERDTIEIRRARSIELGNIRAASKSAEITGKRDESRIQIKRFNGNDKTIDRETVVTRYRNINTGISGENRIVTIGKENETTDESIVANWQYVFYTLQGIYLCGLLIEMLMPTHNQKSKMRNWWQLQSQRLIKVD